MNASRQSSRTVEQWANELAEDIDWHFLQAHERLEEVYRREFKALPAVMRRHWQHRRDIPADLAALPRSLWRIVRRRPQSVRPLTGKEQAVAQLLADHVIDLNGLQTLLMNRLTSHPDYDPNAVAQLQSELAPLQPELAERRLKQAVARWGLSQDSSRDMLVFLALGLAGRGLSDKVLFGSASLLGASAASSLYIANQGWLAAWWSSWVGVPAWVSISGAAAGMVGVLLLTPLAAPFVECGMNRMWRRQRLHRLLDEVHRQLRPPLREQLWHYGSYLQFLPDLLLLLRQLK